MLEVCFMIHLKINARYGFVVVIALASAWCFVQAYSEGAASSKFVGSPASDSTIRGGVINNATSLRFMDGSNTFVASDAILVAKNTSETDDYELYPIGWDTLCFDNWVMFPTVETAF